MFFSDEEENEEVIRHDSARLQLTKLEVYCRGFLTGSSATMFGVSLFVMWTAYDPRSGAIQELAGWSYPLFRSSFFLSLTALCFGTFNFVARRLRVDLERVFDVQRANLKYQWILNEAQVVMIFTFFTFCVYVNALVFKDGTTFSLMPDRFAEATPLVAFFAPFVAWLWPLESFPSASRPGSRRARFSLITHVVVPGAGTCFGFGRAPTFAQTFAADVLCSMPKVFSDCAFAVVLICRLDASRLPTIQAFLDGLPFAVRFLQSTRLTAETTSKKDKEPTLPFELLRRPDAWNAAKYAMAVALVVTSVLEHGGRAWFALSVACTLYNFLWDVVMDWGLLRLHGLGFFATHRRHPGAAPRPGRRSSHRHHPIFSHYFPRWVFCAAVAVDGLFRLGWAVYVSPRQQIVRQHVILVLGSVEIVRRFIWAVFRVVHEQIKLDLRDNNDYFHLLELRESPKIPTACSAPSIPPPTELTRLADAEL